MAGLSADIQQSIINWIRGSAMPTPPASLVVALSSTEILDDGTGLTEPPVLNGYGRQSVTLSAPVHTQGTGTKVSNQSALIFGPAVNSDWPTITHAAVLDDQGNLIFHGPVAAPRTNPDGDTLSYGVGTLQFNVR
jgi:hypothetical protein